MHSARLALVIAFIMLSPPRTAGARPIDDGLSTREVRFLEQAFKAGVEMARAMKRHERRDTRFLKRFPNRLAFDGPPQPLVEERHLAPLNGPADRVRNRLETRQDDPPPPKNLKTSKADKEVLKELNRNRLDKVYLFGVSRAYPFFPNQAPCGSMRRHLLSPVNETVDDPSKDEAASRRALTAEPSSVCYWAYTAEGIQCLPKGRSAAREKRGADQSSGDGRVRCGEGIQRTHTRRDTLRSNC